MVKAMDCRIVVSEFVLQSRYYVHFLANALVMDCGILVLYSHMLQLYTYTYPCACRINDTVIKTSKDFLKKIYLSLYLKGCVCERELETEQNYNILTSPAPLGIAVCGSRSPGLLNRGLGGPASLEHVLIPASSL